MVDAKCAIARYSIYMPNLFQKFIWRVRDLALPIGPPVFLTFLVLLLLIINGAIVWSRW
jgi:hypothetical protein